MAIGQCRYTFTFKKHPFDGIIVGRHLSFHNLPSSLTFDLAATHYFLYLSPPLQGNTVRIIHDTCCDASVIGISTSRRRAQQALRFLTAVLRLGSCSLRSFELGSFESPVTHFVGCVTRSPFCGGLCSIISYLVSVMRPRNCVLGSCVVRGFAGFAGFAAVAIGLSHFR